MCAFLSKLLNVPTEPEPRKFNDPVFIIGSMRSGTTLLMNLLSEHPQLLKIGFELNRVWTEIGGAPIHNGCLERTEEHFKPEYANNMTAYFTNYLNNSRTFLRRLSRLSQANYYGSGGINYDWENIFLLNKSPHLSNKVRYINSLYPNSKFIAIVRSPYGQCASLKMKFLKSKETEDRLRYLSPEKGVCWQGFQQERIKDFPVDRIFPGNFNLLAEAWIDINFTMLNHLESIPDDRKVILSYESLIENREKSLKKVFVTLDLNKSHKEAERKIIEKERKIHNTSTKGNPLEKWRDHLKDREQQRLKEMLISESERYSFIKSVVPEVAKYWNF